MNVFVLFLIDTYRPPPTKICCYLNTISSFRLLTLADSKRMSVGLEEKNSMVENLFLFLFFLKVTLKSRFYP